MKISIIVPFYNAQETLGDCIESLLALNDAECEIFVVDNASTDDSLKIAQSYENRVSNMNYRVLEESKRGREYARNLGAKEAAGELLAFTDADCIVDSNWSREIRGAFQLHPEWDGGGGNIKGAAPNNLVQKFLSLYTLRAHFTEPKEFTSFDLFQGGFPGANLIARKKIFEKIGGFNELPYASGDFDLCAQVYAHSGKMGAIPNAIVFHQHRSTVEAMCRQAYTTGRAQSVLMKKYFPQDWILEIPGKRLRGKGLNFPLWLNCTYLDKKVFMGLVLAGLWPPLIFILIGYFIYLMLQAQKVAQEENLPLLITEKIGVLALMFLKSFSMTLGRFIEGLKQKGVSL